MNKIKCPDCGKDMQYQEQGSRGHINYGRLTCECGKDIAGMSMGDNVEIILDRNEKTC
jgi:hypothetical protein